MTSTNTLDKSAIADRLVEIANEINEYDDIGYRFDVVIQKDGTVMRGDLHINSNSWTEWHDKDEIFAEFIIHPAYTSQTIRAAGEDAGDKETVEAWREEAEYRIRQFANEIAEAAVNGDSIEEIESIGNRMWT